VAASRRGAGDIVIALERSPFGRLALRTIPFIVFSVGWQLLAVKLQRLPLPTFTETVRAFANLVTTPIFWRALWLSHQALLVGFAAAVVIGIAVGILVGRSAAIDALLDPYLTILLITPMAAVIPLVIISFGIGLFARALVVTLFSVVAVVINTRAGVRTLAPGWLEMVRSFGATEAQIWRMVVVPGALPSIVTGVRLGLGRAFAGMIAVEMLLASVGIGRLILDFQGSFEAGAVYAAVMVLVGEVTVLLRALRSLEARLMDSGSSLAVE
jgi:NitT/TauT family transport system permease protein